MTKKDISDQIEILERTERYEVYVEKETGEIKTRVLIDLEQNIVFDKKELERRRQYYADLKAEAERFQKMKQRKEEKKAKAAAMKDDNRGEFFMQGLGKYSEREKEEVKARIKGLTLTEEGYYFSLLTFYFVCSKKPLMYKENEKAEILINKHIEKQFKISKGRVSQLVKKFKDAKLLEKKPNQKGYFVTEKYFKMNISANGEYVTRIYQTKLKEVIEEIGNLVEDVNEQMACVGLIHRLGYMVHQQTYHICSNPDKNICKSGETVTQALDRDPNAISYFGTREFLKALSPIGKEVNKETLSFRIQVLFSAGVITQTIGAGVVYQIHPDLMHRQFTDGIDDYSNEVRRAFNTTMAAGRQQLTVAKRRRTTIKKKAKVYKEISLKKKQN